jgi:hypothetical protein
MLVTDVPDSDDEPFVGYKSGAIDRYTGLTAIPSYVVVVPATDDPDLQDKVKDLVDFVDSAWSSAGNTAFVPNVTAGTAYSVPTFKDVTYYPENPNFAADVGGSSFQYNSWRTEGDVTRYVTSADYMQPFDCPESVVNDSGECWNPQVYALIVLNAANADGWDYTIRMNSTDGNAGDGYNFATDSVGSVPNTATNFGQSNVDVLKVEMDLLPQQMYTSNGFMTLQLMMDRYIINKCYEAGNCDTAPVLDPPFTVPMKTAFVNTLIGTDANQFPNGMGNWVDGELYAPQNVHATPMPIQSYSINETYSSIDFVISLIFILSTLPILAGILTDLVVEKETKMREVLRIYGVSTGGMLSSWYTWYLLKFFCTALLIALAASVNLLPNSDVVIIFLFFFFFLTSVMGFGFMASQLFDRSKTASVVGTLLWFTMYFMNDLVANSSQAEKTLASVLAPIAFSQVPPQ